MKDYTALENAAIPWWWADDEEGPYQGPFNSRDDAISEAFQARAQCFDDPASSAAFFLLNGKQYPNPDYDPSDCLYDCENQKFHIGGKPECVSADDIHDMFYDAWVKRIPAGWKLVPMEPTPEMRAAWSEATKISNNENYGRDADPETIWIVGVAAATEHVTPQGQSHD